MRMRKTTIALDKVTVFVMKSSDRNIVNAKLEC